MGRIMEHKLSIVNTIKKKIDLSEKVLDILLIIFVFISGIYFFSFITADTDLWGHICFGKEILSLMAIPATDPYSYTAYGHAWINHEWISEVLMWTTFNLFGAPGLLIGKMIVGLIVILIITIICFDRKVSCLPFGIIGAASVFIISPGFMVRPQLMTFLCTALFLIVIYYYLEKRKNLLWLLPLIMIFWVNSHGGFIIGAGILPVIFIMEYLDCYFNNKDKSHLRRFAIWGLFTEAAVLVNPYGYNLLIFIYDTITLPRQITEWESVTLFDLSYLRFKIFSICVIMAFFIKRHENRYWEIGVILFALIFAFMHQRHVPILAIFAAPFLVEKFSIIEWHYKLDLKKFSFLSQVILGFSVVLIIGYQLTVTVDNHIRARFNIIVNPNKYPISAVQFLRDNNIKGNLLVPFDWGEYAIWKLYPDNKVSIDGRFDTVYPIDVINDHFAGAGREDAWHYLINKYLTDIILAERNLFSQRMISEPSDEWVYIYSDNTSVIFLRNSEINKALVERFKNKKMVYHRGKLSIYFP
jgi:hypothetical protein